MRWLERIAIALLLFCCIGLVIKWRLGEETNEVLSFGFDLAASRSHVEVGMSCPEVLTLVKYAPDQVATEGDDKVYHWSTFYRDTFLRKLVYRRRENGQYWVNIRCNSRNEVKSFHYRFG